MSEKEIYTDYNFARVGQVRDFRVHNVTTTERNSLSLALGAGNSGLHVYDTTIKSAYYWDGAAFQPVSPVIAGAMVYKGTYSDTVNTPTTPEMGHVYVWNGGNSTLTWSTQTFNPDAIVQNGDQIIYRGSGVWDIFQADLNPASETDAGYIAISTQAATNAGTNDTTAVTPSKLNGYRVAKSLASVYFASSVNTSALTPLTITHNLNLQNRNSFVISIKNSAHSEITLDVDSIDVNSLTITSSIALTGLFVSIVGF